MEPKAYVAHIFHIMRAIMDVAEADGMVTGSIQQRGCFEELLDCSEALCNPDVLSEIQKTTTCGALYEMPQIVWDA